MYIVFFPFNVIIFFFFKLFSNFKLDQKSIQPAQIVMGKNIVGKQ